MTTMLESLNSGLQRAFASDDRVYLLGEDVLDPYGGAFKVTQGLSSVYPERVLTTPISEAGIVGVATGMALRGLRPVVEIMFGDFITLAADQVINHMTKFRWMYNDKVRVPVVMRTPMGGRRGYGPTHSQTLEKLFMGVPGLRILAATAIATLDQNDAGSLLEGAILYEDDPVLFIENKLLYTSPLVNEANAADFVIQAHNIEGGGRSQGDGMISTSPTFTLTVRGAPLPVLTIAAYGYMAELARQAALRLAYESEIFAELVVPVQLAPFDLSKVIASAGNTRKLLVLEEGNLSMGWGAEVIARTVERLGDHLKSARRLAAEDLPIPASPVLENQVLPSIDDIVQIASEMV